jgi:hypothetical protein
MESHHQDGRRSSSQGHSSTIDQATMQTSRGHSRDGTTEQSPSQSSSFSSSSSEPSIAGDIDTEIPHQTTNVTSLSIRKRPRISDLQQHASTSLITNEKHPARSLMPPANPPKRRCATASPVAKAQTRFTSPDRYIPRRPGADSSSSPFRVSKPPSTLRGRELYTRSRDSTRNPFRSTSDRSNQTASRRNAAHGFGLRTPHYTPSFVNDVDASPFPFDSRHQASTRHPSWGGFWTAGGRGSPHVGQLRAVQFGPGESLASGTNAPMHTPPFLDVPTADDKIRAHESRLALALGIDVASRVLDYAPRTAESFTTSPASASGMKWRDGQWTTDPLQKCRCCTLSRGDRADSSSSKPSDCRRRRRKGHSERSLPSPRCASSQRRLLLLHTCIQFYFSYACCSLDSQGIPMD